MKFIERRVVTPTMALAASVGFVAAAAFATPEAKAQAGSPTFKVCMYERTNYESTPGCSNKSRAKIPLKWNDVISSVKVKAGTAVELFADGDFGGKSIRLTADSSGANLAEFGFDNVVSSFKVTVDQGNGGDEVADNDEGEDEGTDEGGGDEPADNGGDGDEPADNDGDGDEPADNGGDDDEVADNGGDGDEPADNGGDDDEVADNDGDGDEPADNGGDDDEVADNGGDGDEPADNGGDDDEVADNGGDEGTDDDGGNTLPAPPMTIADRIREGSPVVTRTFYNDEIAVYFGEGMDPSVDWMNEYIEEVWKYMKETYGYFGPDNRIYVVAHADPTFGYATISNRFDARFGYRNTIDLGGSWDWSNPSQGNYEVITHELGHIVEGANNDSNESPSFEFWGDSKWAEIFIYDVYQALGKTEWADEWFDRMQTSTGGYDDSFAFRDFYYPLYEQFGVEVYDRYFKLLTECFPTREIDVADNATAREHSRRANPGEVLHFFSGAAGESVLTQFTSAFGWTNETEAQFSQAQADFGCVDSYSYQ